MYAMKTDRLDIRRKERNFPTMYSGLPERREYPMPDAAHCAVRQKHLFPILSRRIETAARTWLVLERAKPLRCRYRIVRAYFRMQEKAYTEKSPKKKNGTPLR